MTHRLIRLDYIIPPSENDAIFIMSNFVQTDQVQSQCAESILLKEARCKGDHDCQNKPMSSRASGRWTGRCMLSPDVDVSNSTTNFTTRPAGLCEYAGRGTGRTELRRVPQTLNRYSAGVIESRDRHVVLLRQGQYFSCQQRLFYLRICESAAEKQHG